MPSYTYEYTINDSKNIINKIHPKLEITRKIIIDKLFNQFYNSCIKINNKITKHKTDDFITRFCWKNISNFDSVIPFSKNNNYNYDQLKIDLFNYNIKLNDIFADFNIEKYLLKYVKIYYKYYKQLDCNDNIIIQNIDNKLIYKNKYIVEYNDVVFDKLNKFYNNKFNNKLSLIFCLLYRYNLMDAKNQQLAIIIPFKEQLKQDFGINIELFGSSINRYFDNYCSLFYDLEKHFGSLGNFFNFQPKQGLYMANPPYDEELMENMAKYLINCLNKNNNQKPLGFVITIPIWDISTLKNISKKCNIKYQNMGPYKCYELLKKSKYFYSEYLFCKKNFPYYNFSLGEIIYASNTYIIIIKNTLLNIDTSLFENLLLKNNLIFIK